MKTCHFCGKQEASIDINTFTVCSECNQIFCSEHIYADDIRKIKICESCLQKRSREQVSPFGKKKPLDPMERYLPNSPPIDAPIQNSSLNKDSSYKRDSNKRDSNLNETKPTFSPQIETSTKDKPIEAPKPFESVVPKWEYKMMFLPLESEMAYDYALFDKRSKNPAESFIFEPMDNPLPNIDWMNDLGEDGWELVSVIPRTKGLLLKSEDQKSFSTSGGHMVGAFLIFKRRRIE